MNKVIRALALENKIRVLATDTTAMMQDVQKLHKSYASSSAALGRSMSVAALMGALLKDEKDSLRIELRGDGPMKYLFVDIDFNGNMRSMVGNPKVMMLNKENGKIDVGSALGLGSLKVIQKRQGRDDFVSTVPLQTGEIGDDFAYYFAQSEQIPSALSVGVLVDKDGSILSSGALLFQILPGASENEISAVEKVLENLQPMSAMLLENELEAIVESLFPDIKIMEQSQVHLACSCTRDEMQKALTALSADDIDYLIEKDNQAKLECHYCLKNYLFTKEDLLAIKKTKEMS